MTSLDIAREAYRAISLYAPNRAPAAIDLSDNTNLWGIPPEASRVISQAAGDTITRYPPLYAAELKHAIATYLDVTPDMIVTGCGSDDVLDSAIRAFGDPGDTVAHMDPSFAMIPIFAQMNGLQTRPIPLTQTFDVDPDTVIAAQAKITYLCSPNNPTSTAISRSSIRTILDNTTGIIVVDEAYAEFATDSVVDLLSAYPKLIVTRTFSKAFGLAGLRIGYAIGNPTIIAEVEKSRGPYKVNAIAERAAIAAIRTDGQWVRDRIEEARSNRVQLVEELKNRGFSPLPSEANFVLVPVADAVALDNRMRNLGVAVRPFAALPGIGDAIRISIGPWGMMQQCLEVLDLEVLDLEVLDTAVARTSP